jgi:hypothetical protein
VRANLAFLPCNDAAPLCSSEKIQYTMSVFTQPLPFSRWFTAFGGLAAHPWHAKDGAQLQELALFFIRLLHLFNWGCLLYAFALLAFAQELNRVLATLLISATGRLSLLLTADDKGAGIAEENMAFTFDPSYTNRMGQGGFGAGRWHSLRHQPAPGCARRHCLKTRAKENR